MSHKPLYLVTDMYGCPNRCRHCWLGHMPNRAMEPGADAWLVDYFRPDFETVVFYSWLREPDFCDSYRARWAGSRSGSSWPASGGWPGTRTTRDF